MASILDYNKTLTKASSGGYTPSFQSIQQQFPQAQIQRTYSSPVVGGSSGGASAPAPAAQQSTSAPMQDAPSAPAIDFDALIRPALDALDSAVGPLQQSTDATIQGINSTRQTQTATTNQQIGAQQNTINQAKTDQQGYERSAADEARRQYSEVQQGLQSRYGGTTGTGAFATELAGGQTIRSIAGIHEAASKALAGLEDKRVQVQEIGRIALQQIENDANDQIAKAKSQLELSLADIRNQKGQLLAHKAEMAANAMQHYQDTVNQVNANNTAFKQQLFLQQQAAQQQLEAAKQRASSITGSANPTDLSGLVQSLSIPEGYTASVSQRLPGGGTISLSPKKKDTDSGNFSTGDPEMDSLLNK